MKPKNNIPKVGDKEIPRIDYNSTEEEKKAFNLIIANLAQVSEEVAIISQCEFSLQVLESSGNAQVRYRNIDQGDHVIGMREREFVISSGQHRTISVPSEQGIYGVTCDSKLKGFVWVKS